ncbi:hypothetical protein ACSBM8_18885 [Sphingomonas sp. ASY06-1R]|jgi:hypothetical protein|uniref:hypothetical protein n=1 Tax=Sphingomonas sp. ASY06-1R TaxID=3445771 RepID=UPI003FA217DE
MRRPWKAVLGLALLIVMALVLTPLVVHHLRWTQLIEREARDQEVTYRCARQTGAADFDPRLAGPTLLRLIARRKGGKRSWKVVVPGSAPVSATSFPAGDGNIGGSHGLRWISPDGQKKEILLWFSDIVGEFGPDTIWVDHLPKPVPALGQLTCGPVSRTFLSVL